MHHHRLVLNGPQNAVARLAEELRAQGAEPVGTAPPRLVWATARADAVEDACARHPDVVVGVERFAALGTELERLVVHGEDATLLERQPFGDEPGPLGAAALRRAALAIADVPPAPGPGSAGTSLDDALLVGPALGAVCVAAGDPAAEERPSPAALDAVRGLGAVALTVGANASAPACAAELAFERAWRLAQATAFATQAARWTRPDDDWPEWLMFLLACAAGLVESCAASLHRAPPEVKSLFLEHHATAGEELEHAAGLLAMVALQAVALFDGG